MNTRLRKNLALVAFFACALALAVFAACAPGTPEAEEATDTPIPPPSPTPTLPPSPTPTETPVPPTEAPTATPDPAAGALRYPQPLNDVELVTDDLTGTGQFPANHPADIGEVWTYWDEEGRLVVCVGREKSARSNSSGLQVLLLPTVNSRDIVGMYVWQDHDEAITRHVFTPDGELPPDQAAAILDVTHDVAGMQVCFFISDAVEKGAQAAVVRSFDRPNEGELRGFDYTREPLPLPDLSPDT